MFHIEAHVYSYLAIFIGQDLRKEKFFGSQNEKGSRVFLFFVRIDVHDVTR